MITLLLSDPAFLFRKYGGRSERGFVGSKNSRVWRKEKREDFGIASNLTYYIRKSKTWIDVIGFYATLKHERFVIYRSPHGNRQH